ncbi:type VI secretion system tip protein TssI/VgrG [Thalassobaculum sp.]|uniref:type VI secretion system Vgr family protein n=1 Tax=Thalassobaculum sp. TaxID=2022740 RepID=UPI0032ECE848
MADAYVQSLEFTVDGQPSSTFAVFRLTGREAVSELFRFDVDVVSENSGIALPTLAGKDATLTITRLGQTRKVHGMLEGIELSGMTPQGQCVYRAVLVPRLQKLALSRQNQIHGTTTPVSVREVLSDELSASALKGTPAAGVAGRLSLNDFELRLTHPYPKRDYIVQYDESDFDFISRQCEHYGIFYFFTHDSGRDVVVFGDSRIAFPTVSGPGRLAYRPGSGLANASAASVFQFSGRSTLVPAQVCLRDYNYRLPNLTLDVDETVDSDGHGVVVDYGSHFRTPQEGRDLARVRAQELASHKLSFQGRSDSVHLIAGAVFDLTEHFRSDFNTGYLITWIEHEASQALPGIAEIAGPDHQTAYSNHFGCLPKSVEFRPARKTPKPRMAGLSNATVDASGNGQRAEIDSTGRYKIRQQFDQRGEGAGQASRYMRKAEPYGGANTGMHFPLLKDTEVILACVNGDPDRPIIVGAMQNEQYPSVVNSRSSTKNRMRTTSGALFEIDDGPARGGGSGGASSGGALAPQRALEGTDAASSAVRGATSQPLAGQRAESDIQTSGDSTSSYARLQVTAGTDSYWRLGSEPTDTTEDSRTPGMSDMEGGSSAGADGLFEYSAGDRTSLIKGSSYAQVDVNRLDYVAGTRRMSAATHNAVSKGQYQVIANGVSIEASTGTISDNSSPSEAGAGELVLTSKNDLTENIGGSYNQNVTVDSITRTDGTEVSQTWGSTASFMMGSAISMTLGSEITINLSSAISITSGIKFELFLGIAYAFRIGPSFELSTSPAVELSAISDITTKSSEIQSVAAKVGAAPLQLLTSAATVAQNGIQAAVGSIKAKVTGADVTV